MITRVLLIDDDDEDQDFFISQLSEYNQNIEVVSAYNGKQALDMLSWVEPHYIFLDINLPGMNGMDVLQKINEKSLVHDVPVYMYSTSDGFNSKKKALELGAAHYYRKPDSPEGITSIFKEVFEQQ